MGWCSGTELFDDVLSLLDRALRDDPEITWDEAVEELITAFKRHDWDCESDSRYWKHTVQPALARLKQRNDKN